MKISRPIIVATCFVAAIIVGLWLYVRDLEPVRTEPASPSLAGKPPTPITPVTAPRRGRNSELPNLDSADAAAATAGGLERLLRRMKNGEFPKLSAEVIEKFLEQHGRDSASLLAAWQGSANREYLREAATHFPDDPRVQFEVLANNALPEDRAQWIARFKESSPDNPLANYFAAHELFGQKQTEQAVAEILAASGKDGFNDFLSASLEGREQLFLTASESPLDAKALAMTGQTLPFLQTLRTLSRELADAQAAYTAQGDDATAKKLTIMELQMGEQLSLGGGGRMLVNQLVGIAIWSNVLSQLEANQQIDWLGGTPAERLAMLNEQKQSIKNLVQDFDSTLSHSGEADLLTYFDMIKSEGELAAMQWLVARPKSP